jgi:hypothetical protein
VALTLLRVQSKNGFCGVNNDMQVSGTEYRYYMLAVNRFIPTGMSFEIKTKRNFV